MKSIGSFKIDKGVLSIISLSEESDEREYWHSKTPYERLESIELMRQINYGYDPTTSRVQRVLEVAQLTSS